MNPLQCNDVVGVHGGAILGRNLRDFFYPLLSGFIAILYGSALSQIPNELFKDFTNYLIYAESSLFILLGRLSDGPLGLMVNEPIWLLINAGLGLLLEPEGVVRSIIFFSASLIAWLVLIHYPRRAWWLLIFLLLPTVVKNHLIHLRQGLAIAIFLWGWHSKRRFVCWFLIAVAPLVHASFFFILVLFLLSKGLRNLNLGIGIQTIIVFAVGLIFGSGLWYVAAYLGARQAEESEFSAAGISGLGFVFWALMFFLWMSSGKKFLEKFNFETAIFAFYLSTYWIVGVSARIFESVLLLVLLGSLSMPSTQRKFFLATTTIFGCWMWLLRVGSPALGFGISS